MQCWFHWGKTLFIDYLNLFVLGMILTVLNKIVSALIETSQETKA